MMEHQNSLRPFAQVMVWITSFAAVALPVLTIMIWIYIKDLGVSSGTVRPQYDLTSLSLTARLLGFVICFIGAGIMTYGLLALRRTFQEAAAGRGLSLTAVVNFRRFALVTLVTAFYGILQNTLLSIVFTMGRPGQETQLSIMLGTPEVKALFTALLFVFVAHIFAAGRKAEEENAQFL